MTLSSLAVRFAPLLSSQPTDVRLPRVPVKTDTTVLKPEPCVLMLNVPVAGATKRYQTVLAVVMLQAVVGSSPALVDAMVVCVVP